MNTRQNHGVKKQSWSLTGLIIAMIFSTSVVCAQSLSDTIKTVEIPGRHKATLDPINDFATGQKNISIDSTTLKQYQQQSIAALLSQQVPVFVKSYSFNGLATLSFRGASAAQSQVRWNGIPIQNAALGVADVSTLPVLFMTRVNITYGSSGALYGSGNVGGTLMLENENPTFDTSSTHLAVSAGSGSFGQYSGGLKGSIANKKWFLSANTFMQSASNSYEFTTQAGTKDRMSNATLRSYAGMVHSGYKINEQNTLSLSAWVQQYNREIPPALFETYSAKNQQDNAYRLVAGWQQTHPTYTLFAKSSVIRDEIRYNDAAVLLSTTNAVCQYFQDAGWKQHLGHSGQLLLSIPAQWSWIPAAPPTQQQKRIALVAAYDQKMLKNKLNISIQSRAEQINNTSIFLPGAGIEYRITSWLSATANVQRTYRMPSLNELYYFPGGNALLRPEHGWNEDAGYNVKVSSGRFHFYHSLSAYNRNIHDWILWLGGAIWTPHNIATVHSRGTESENKITFKTGTLLLHASVGTAYSLATTTASYILNDGSIGRQIPYTPRYNGRLNLGFTWHRIYINYNHTYTGYRFITTDESSWIPPYQTGNLQAMYNCTLKNRPIQLNAACNNIWQEHYSIAGFRPMPGINWLLGCSLQIL